MMPSAEDMQGIMDVLINLRNVYQYRVHDLAVGVIGPFKTDITLSCEYITFFKADSEFPSLTLHD